MKRKHRNIILAILMVISLSLFPGCNSCSSCNKIINELKSESGVTLVGGNFEKQAKLITEKLQATDENVQQSIERLPDEFQTYEGSDLVAMDISVQSKGVKVQPDGKVKVSVPTPIEGVTKYWVFHIKSEKEVEQLEAEFKDGKLTFETDSFSMFIFIDAESGEKVTIKNQGPCEGRVIVKITTKGYFRDIVKEFNINTDEEKTFYIKKGTIIDISLLGGYDIDYKGLYREVNGVVEDKPFTTEQFPQYTVEEGEQILVAKFAGNLNGVYQLWAFPGESGVPAVFNDGRAATELYIKPGNPNNIDVTALIIKGLKRKNDKLRYTLLSPEQYDIIGLDELDYSKEGTYRVEFIAKENKELWASITIHVSEKNGDVSAFTTTGGKFYVDDKADELLNEKSFLFTNTMYKLTAVPDSTFDFGGWYVCHEGGIVGKKLSDELVYEVKLSEYDLTILALFTIKPEFSNKQGVYQVRIEPGESNIPLGFHDGKPTEYIASSIFYKPGAPEIDLLKLEIKGLRRNDELEYPYEYVPLYFGDYTIDYDGLDFRKEGKYNVKYKLVSEDVEDSFTVYVSNQFSHLTVEFSGKGKVEDVRYGKYPITKSDTPETLEYFPLYDCRKIVATPAEGYKFIGWYSVDENGKCSEEPISLESEYLYYQNGKDEHIKAMFVEIITNLTVSCDGFEDGNFYYNLDRKEMPNLANLVVKNEKGRTLNASEFIVDASKVDYEKTGIYEITITYKYDKDVKATLTVEVPKAETYSYIESEDVEKGVIKMNGEIIVKDPDGYREEVELGGTLTLTAEPKEGYKFAGWYITNSLNGEKRLYSTNETETFTITDNTYIFAKFIEKDMVTLTVIAGEGGYVFEYHETGTSQNMKRLELAVKEGEKVKVSASGEYVYSKFVGWYDGEGENATLISTESLHEFIVTANATVYARFEKAFYVNARIENGGEFVDSPYVSEGGFYRDDLPENSEVTIEVKAKEGYYFVGWFISADYYSAEGLLSTELKHTFIVNEETNNLNLTALFRAIATEIKLEDSSDYGFYLDNEGKLVTEYLLNLNQEFYAMPDGQPLLGKIGDKYERLILGLEYKVESTINYTKNGMFDTSKEGTYTITYTYLNNPELKVVMNFKVVELVRFLAQCMPHNSGYLLEDGQRVDFANGKLVEKGTKITLTAVANSEYNFVGWFYFDSDQSEKLISTDATYTFTVNEERYVYAKFVEKEMHLFNAYSTEAGYITENGQEVDFGNGRRVEKGTKITLTAHVKVEGYRFVGWYTSTDQNETLISTDETYTFIVNENMFVFSKFEIIEA